MAIIAISGKLGSGKDLTGEIVQILTQSPHFTNKAVVSFLNRELNNPLFENKKFADSLKDIICMLLGCTRKELENRDFKESELPEEWWYYKLELEGGYGPCLYNYLDGYPDNVEGAKLIKPTPRMLLQQMGTECGRDILHPNIWVNALFGDYKSKLEVIHKLAGEEVDEDYEPQESDIVDVYPKWIITDMRFPNELKAVKDRGGITIRINRFYNKGCPLCGSPEISANTPRTVYKNGCSDYDQRPNTFKKVCKEHLSETALDNAEFDYTIENNSTIEDLVGKVREILIKENFIKNE